MGFKGDFRQWEHLLRGWWLTIQPAILVLNWLCAKCGFNVSLNASGISYDPLFGPIDLATH